MELAWYETLLYGLVSGLAEFLPISGEAHRSLLLTLFGASDHPLLRLSVHLGALLAVIFSCIPILSRLGRERRIAKTPARKRRRQPDLRSLLEIRHLKTALLPVLICFLLYSVVDRERMWVLAFMLVLNGILLYVPQFQYNGNKDALTLSALDTFLMGLSGGLGMIPGFSRIGSVVSTGLLRGADRRYALDFAFLLSVPVLLVWLVCDGVAVFQSASIPFLIGVVQCFFAFVTSFIGAGVGIFFMRFLSVNTGFSGFAYYCWGMALLTFFLYLI